MMSALYPERRERLEWLAGVPGWPGFVAAAILGLAGSVLAVVGDRSAPRVPVGPQADIATLRAAVDSAAGDVRRLRDSLRLAVAARAEHATRGAAARTPHVPRVPTAGRARAATVPASPILPPPPALQQIQAETATPP